MAIRADARERTSSASAGQKGATIKSRREVVRCVMRSPKFYSAGGEQSLGAKLRAPGDEWSPAVRRIIQGRKEDLEPLGPHRERFFKLDPMLMRPCLSNCIKPFFPQV
jgi:hypothetical protein